jgi:hypothetical protein
MATRRNDPWIKIDTANHVYRAFLGLPGNLQEYRLVRHVTKKTRRRKSEFIGYRSERRSWTITRYEVYAVGADGTLEQIDNHRADSLESAKAIARRHHLDGVRPDYPTF